MHIEHVADPADPRLADFRDLTDTALRRRSEPVGGLYIAESEKVIARALAAGHAPRAVLLQERRLAGIRRLIADRDVPVYVVDDATAEAITGYAVHRGALASMHRPVLPSPAEVLAGARTVLVLESLIEHTNVGAAFRAAAGLGADAVLVSANCADPLYRRSIKVSTGCVFQVPWARFADWTELTAALDGAGFAAAALALSDDAVPLDAYTRPERLALVLGTEGDGLSAQALAAADDVVMIPMAGGVDSLNVAAAAAVALWQLRA